MPDSTSLPRNVEETRGLLASGRYVADASLATAVFLALKLGRPLLLEGEAGVGKTEIAKVLAATLGRRLIRLQCYEGLDAAAALYEWNYPRQMLEIRLAEVGGEGGAAGRERLAHDIFDPRFLLKRPLLLALEPDPAGPPVLLIDEIDRTDEPFEAFLLEILSDFQMTIPEMGTVRAPEPPIVVLTSNRTREVHDALKRRCLYHWIGYPDAARELEILRLRAPELAESLAGQIVRFVQQLRTADLFKLPGVAETIDWGRALLALDQVSLDAATVNSTLGVLLKYQDDIEKMAGAPVSAMLAGKPLPRSWPTTSSTSPASCAAPASAWGRRALSTPWPRPRPWMCSIARNSTGPSTRSWSGVPRISTSSSRRSGCSGAIRSASRPPWPRCCRTPACLPRPWSPAGSPRPGILRPPRERPRRRRSNSTPRSPSRPTRSCARATSSR